MLSIMHRIVLMLVFVACVVHGRRVHMSNEPLVDAAPPFSLAEVSQSSRELSATGGRSSFKSFANLLMAMNLADKVPGPAWTRGEIEAPAGTRDMGGWIMAVYTPEQQKRLQVDEKGQPQRNSTESEVPAGRADNTTAAAN
mmetsp:Transcript_99714/g.175715  ORF Transcript_99714/g.175715 Transcript_99714/m.175715 type:complete len:141 (-) Transcript_99714:73-495(-)